MNEQEKAQVIQGDTLTLLLCNRVNAWLDDKSRAIQIARCCKKIRNKTKDSCLYEACRSVIKATSGGAYKDVIKSMELTELNYFKEYQS